MTVEEIKQHIETSLFERFRGNEINKKLIEDLREIVRSFVAQQLKEKELPLPVITPYLDKINLGIIEVDLIGYLQLVASDRRKRAVDAMLDQYRGLGAEDVTGEAIKFTCDECGARFTCDLAFDEYNQNGDCLAEK